MISSFFINKLQKVGIGLSAVIIISSLDSISSELLVSIKEIDIFVLFLAFIFCLVYRVINTFGWTSILNSLGGNLSFLNGASIWLYTESFRWLPGSVWGYLSRTHEAVQTGVGKKRAVASVSFELVLTVLAWIVTALVAGLFSEELYAMIKPFIASRKTLLFSFVAFLFSLVLILKSKKIRTKLDKLSASACFFKENVEAFLRTLVLYICLCFFNGVCFYLICQSLSLSQVSLVFAVASNALAFLIGLFAMFAPGGIGVREGGFVLFLAPTIGFENALVAALLWRFVQVSVEILCATVVFTLRSGNQCSSELFKAEVV